MILEGIAKASGWVSSLLELLFTTVVNIVVTPLSLLYTLLTQTAEGKWKLSDLSGIYYFWWSHRDKIIKCSNELGLTGVVTKHSKHPRTFMVVLGLVLLPIILAAAIRLLVQLCASKSENVEDDTVIDAEVTQEPPIYKDRKRRK